MHNKKEDVIKTLKFEEEMTFNERTYFLITTGITDHAIAEKKAEEERFKYAGVKIGYARVISKQNKGKKIYAVYCHCD